MARARIGIIGGGWWATHAHLPSLTQLKERGVSSILTPTEIGVFLILALIPLALRGVKYRAMGAAALLRRNLWIYGAGGVIIPFIGIKLIDLIITAFRLA